MLRCKLGMLFYTEESIFGVAGELAQKLLVNCYKRLMGDYIVHIGGSSASLSVPVCGGIVSWFRRPVGDCSSHITDR